jgi:predicted dehydrogenase
VIRLAFLGTGWIGRNRMEKMLATGKAEAIALCDPSSEMADGARELAPNASLACSLDEILEMKPDGVVIATPSALHAEQCIQAFKAGAAVFCQKPLGRTAAEVEAVLDAARRADRLLGVDLSYRRTAAMEAIRKQFEAGALGKIFAADLVFHNAFGPGNAWFWDPKLSGGGCLIDLGIHLVDLALWLMDFPELVRAEGRLFRDGRPPRPDEVEDYAAGSLELANGASVRIACSWNLSAGTDAVIRASFHGTGAGAEMRNENGSFFDFTAELFEGRERRTLASPPDDWGGRAGADWVEKLAAGGRFDQSTTGLLETARALDALYGRPASAGSSSAPPLVSVG